MLQVNSDAAVALKDVSKEQDELEAAPAQVGAPNVRWRLTLLATTL